MILRVNFSKQAYFNRLLGARRRIIPGVREPKAPGMASLNDEPVLSDSQKLFTDLPVGP